MHTIDEINAMTPEEVATLNRKLGIKLMKRVALTAAVTVAGIIVVDRLAKKWDNSLETAD